MRTSRAQIKTLIAISNNVEEADKIIDMYYGFNTVGEKIAFLKGMFDIKIVGHQKEQPDEMDYYAMLGSVIDEENTL